MRVSNLEQLSMSTKCSYDKAVDLGIKAKKELLNFVLKSLFTVS